MKSRRHYSSSSPQAAGLLLAGALAIALLAISIARLAGDMGSTAFNLDLARSALEVPIWRSRLGLNLALFILALTGLHLAFGLLCWVLARVSERALPAARCTRRQWVLLWYLAGAAWLLIANARYFPKSSLGEPYQGIVGISVSGVGVLGVATVLLVGSLIAVVVLALIRLPKSRRTLIPFAVVALGAIAGLSMDMNRPADTTPDRPHIILLGIDSLRPDAINATVTPHLKTFMDAAVQMADTITPLARTFPSWTSILTGRHPHTTGAYMNLLPRELIDEGVTLPDHLRAHGYRTWYAIDETRFSNIDSSYGFDRTITPEMGGSDFMLTRIADTPLSNLVMNTWLGSLLFPHVHANRAASIVYDPDSFVHRIGRELEFSQPTLLAVHLTLPHWPFIWASAGTDPVRSSMDELYRESVRRADQQFGDLLLMLERRGVLDNALVVTLSDHGEALGHADEFMAGVFPAGDHAITDYQRWGHGTSVFSPTQYRVVLGFRGYGAASAHLGAPAVRHEPVSLVDIAPTIMDILQLAHTDSFDGVSLAPLLRPGAGQPHDFTDRIRFTESEYNPQGFDTREFSTSQLTAAAQVYRLDPVTDRITVRTDMLDSIMSSRQYAAFLGNRAMGAAVPGLASDGQYTFIHAPLGPGPDAPHVQQQPATPESDSSRLRQALQDRFGITFPASH